MVSWHTEARPCSCLSRPAICCGDQPSLSRPTTCARRASSAASFRRRRRRRRARSWAWHRQVKLEEDGEARKLARAANLCGGFGASDLGPHREGLRADGSVLDGRKVIAVEVEEVVDLVVRREEPLRLAG